MSKKSIGWNGKNLIEMLEESEKLFEDTKYYYGLDKLSLKEQDPFNYERCYASLRGAIVSARETALQDAASPIVKEIGDDGLAFAKAGYCPFHDVMRNYMGYENTYYALNDYPNQLESLLDTLNEQFEKVKKLIINSPAEIITCDGHFDGQLTPRPIYRRYFLPCFKDFSDKIHSAGKLLASHTDSDIS